jgi:hypothetical protein
MADLSDIPNGPHFAIIQTTAVHTPGDERSRTNPGHGYPASTETYITYRAFTDRAKWEEEIKRLSASRWADPFRAIAVTPANIATDVAVTID